MNLSVDFCFNPAILFVKQERELSLYTGYEAYSSSLSTCAVNKPIFNSHKVSCSQSTFILSYVN